MAKIFSSYEVQSDGSGLEKAWYDSSNIKYSECIDREGEYKILTVVFSNGTRYQYRGVNVMNYLKFREDASQGQALNKYIKSEKYEYEKLDDVSLEEINDELSFRTKEKGYFIDNSENEFIITSGNGDVMFKKEKHFDDEYVDDIISILRAFNVNIKLKKE